MKKNGREWVSEWTGARHHQVLDKVGGAVFIVPTVFVINANFIISLLHYFRGANKKNGHYIMWLPIHTVYRFTMNYDIIFVSIPKSIISIICQKGCTTVTWTWWPQKTQLRKRRGHLKYSAQGPQIAKTTTAHRKFLTSCCLVSTST